MSDAFYRPEILEKSARPPFAPGEPRAHVLIVDDDRDARTVCASYCDLFDHASQSVSTLGEATPALRGGVFDVVVAGLDMTGSSGLELVRTIRTLPRPIGAIPIIGLAGLGRADEAQRWLAAGCFAVVAKPVTAARLFAALSEATRSPIPERRSWAPAG